ncbi:metallophosphoesterase [Halodesulfovibrio aestuarii]|uniref:metallophosphoesterase family protein n=1 Tax=Halodesulfovibrio aestuarii TaxID=126333 RepID=UPI003520B7D4
MSDFWICIGDIHDEIARLKDIPELAKARGVIISGDLTMAKGIPAARRVIEAVAAINPVIYAQIGNMDKPEVTEFLEEQGCNIHRSVTELTPEVVIMGVGTSGITPFNTPSETPDETLGKWLDETYAKALPYGATVVVVHDPPFNTACDDLGNGVHVGSKATRAFIEKTQPQLVLCGHIHEARSVDSIGKTLVINTGMLSAGGYAKITLNGTVLNAELCIL